MTVSELYELKREFLKLSIAQPGMRTREYTLLEYFVNYLANWIYMNDTKKSISDRME